MISYKKDIESFISTQYIDLHIIISIDIEKNIKFILPSNFDIKNNNLLIENEQYFTLSFKNLYDFLIKSNLIFEKMLLFSIIKTINKNIILSFFNKFYNDLNFNFDINSLLIHNDSFNLKFYLKKDIQIHYFIEKHTKLAYTNFTYSFSSNKYSNKFKNSLSYFLMIFKFINKFYNFYVKSFDIKKKDFIKLCLFNFYYFKIMQKNIIYNKINTHFKKNKINIITQEIMDFF